MAEDGDDDDDVSTNDGIDERKTFATTSSSSSSSCKDRNGPETRSLLSWDFHRRAGVQRRERAESATSQ